MVPLAANQHLKSLSSQSVFFLSMKIKVYTYAY